LALANSLGRVADWQLFMANQPFTGNQCLSLPGRYLLFRSFKKPISIPAIQSCNI
jgi:hypothetical protein